MLDDAMRIMDATCNAREVCCPHCVHVNRDGWQFAGWESFPECEFCGQQFHVRRVRAGADCRYTSLKMGEWRWVNPEEDDE